MQSKHLTEVFKDERVHRAILIGILVVLEASDMCQSVEELLVYDFDGTLADTPTPITGKEMYKRKTGREWRHNGWWGRKESLEPPLEVYPGPAFSSYLENRLRSDCVRIMMTGRVHKLSARVTECLQRWESRRHVFTSWCLRKGIAIRSNISAMSCGG